MEYRNHFRRMMEERSIRPEWVQNALDMPQRVEDQEDGTRHYLCRIEEHGNRWLRVVVNIRVTPEKAVTTFFDRRLRRTI
jgi:hypothetical protein